MTRLTNGIMSESDLKELDAAKNEKRFHSKLKMFSSTMGIRPNEFSVIVGPAGNGKSTLCKTISIECAVGGRKCYHLLSEEKTSVYKGLIANTFEKMCAGKNTNAFLERLLFESMLDWKEEELNVNNFFDRLEDVINDKTPDMVIFDNFTTSFLGSLPINVQGDMITRLRKMAAQYEIAIIGVFHTAKGSDLYKKLLDGEDVRGNASTTNAGSYNYVISTYFRATPPRAIVNVDKARYHPETNKKFFELLYDKDLGIYTADMMIDYQDVVAIMDGANKKKLDPKKEIRTW